MEESTRTGAKKKQLVSLRRSETLERQEQQQKDRIESWIASPAIQEHVKDAAVQLLEGHEGQQKIIACVSEGNDILKTF